MSSTNKTTNYNLSQFLGSDKPAWLADYNQDMSKIDTQMKANADAATGADGKADANTTNIGDLTYLSTTAKNNLVAAINEVDSNADVATSTANAANTTANGCRTDLNKFNLTNRITLTPTTNFGSLSSGNTFVQFAGDTSNSIFKVYGRISIQNLSGATGNLTVKIGDTPLRPSAAYEINSGIILTSRDGNSAISGVGPRSLKINTDGSVYAVLPSSSYVYSLGNTSVVDLTIMPCLYFNTDFGDQ